MAFVLNVVVGSVLSSFVLYDPLLAVGLKKGVDSFGLVMVAGFPLALDVMMFQIMDSVIVMVVRGSLKI